MSLRLNLRGATAACAVAATVVSGSAFASTINQNTSWTITRSGATSTYRVVAYGDSIYAGYNGSLFSVARRASPYASGEYLGNQWNANIEVVRRTKSGARADDIYNNKIIYERSYMQSANTRVVTFEMCGNDYLQARSAFKDQTGTCSYTGLNTALSNCTYYTEKAMQAINTYATAAKAKIVMNLYYPGYNADNVLTACTDATTGTQVNRRDKFLPLLLKSNWRTCNFAVQYGFKCADAFAESMAADYDSNGDGLIDSDAIRWRAGETETDYVNRILALKGTLRDSNTHFVNSTTSYDYLQSDDTHQTYYKSTIGTGSGSAVPDFTSSQIIGGKNPEWNKWGHERIGWSLSTYNPATP
jgi:lysophospholipase L1-like esterase